MSVFLYNALLLIMSPAIFAAYLWRIFVSRKSNLSWRENFGALPHMAGRPEGQRLIWIHAASVGEVMASLPIQQELRRLLPSASIFLTTITQTGNAVARKSAMYADAVAFLPLDMSGFVEKGLERVRPDIVVLVESEIWPNLLAACRRKGIPTILVNGRISDRTMERHRKLGSKISWLTSWAVSNIDAFCMQTQTDAERIVTLGADPSVVTVEGSTKFDQEGGRLDESAVRQLRSDLGVADDSLVFVAGSTNPGEDEPVLEAFSEMRREFPALKLVVAPRQLERAEEIRGLVMSRGLVCALRSEGTGSPRTFDVLVLNSYGELASVYAVGEVAFVGGTLIRKGGHSIIQPILQGKPVIFGPHTFKTRDVARLALDKGIGFEVSDAHELAEQGLRLLRDRELQERIDTLCRELAESNRGASLRCAKAIVDLLCDRRETAVVTSSRD